MTSKPGKKRARLPRRSDYTKPFKKDGERLTHSGRYDMQALKDTMALIVANEDDLPVSYREHELTGDLADHRECHVGGDFLLIYHLSTPDSVVFVRAGTPSELFG